MKGALAAQAKRREVQDGAIAAAAAAAVADPTVAPIFKARATLSGHCLGSNILETEEWFYLAMQAARNAGQPPWLSDPAVVEAAAAAQRAARRTNQHAGTPPSQQQQHQHQHQPPPQPIDPGTSVHHKELWCALYPKDEHVIHRHINLQELSGRPHDPRALFMQEQLREAAWAAYSERGFEALAHAGALPELQQVRAREGG